MEQDARGIVFDTGQYSDAGSEIQQIVLGENEQKTPDESQGFFTSI